MTFEEIIDTIETHRREYGRIYAGKLYVGITNDVDRRLFGFHRVPRVNHWWVYCPADDVQTARRAEKHYLKNGMQGGDGEGEQQFRYRLLLRGFRQNGGKLIFRRRAVCSRLDNDYS